MIRILLLTLLMLMAYWSAAQWSISQEGTPFVIDFDNTVTGVNNGQFAGSGLTPTPAAGQLNSNAWRITGMSDGNTSFGDTETSGDFARGTSPGGVTTGGMYAFTVAPGNNTLGVQSTGADFTPGAITLRIQNNTGQIINEVDLAYLVYVYNDQNRASFFNFDYSLDDVSYFPVPALNLISPEALDAAPVWVANTRNTTLAGFELSPGDFFYMRWTSHDVSGSGSRDEFALDDIEVSFRNTPAGITQLNTPLIIDFDHGVVDVNNGQFNGTGFNSSPANGQLNSASWAVNPGSGSLNFGGIAETAVFGQGVSTGGVTTGGIYAFEVAAGNRALGVQPTGSLFNNSNNAHYITLRVQNNTGQTVNEVDLAYAFYQYNDQNSSSFMRLGYYEAPLGSENNGLIASGNFAFIDERTTTPAQSGSPSWESETVQATLSGVNLVPGQFLFVRWAIGDVIGGSRDELAIDDISIEFRNVPTGFTDFTIPLIIDFDQGVAGINNGSFTGSGFSPNPASGQLNSNAFITGGWSDSPGSIGFGDTSPTSGDFARGTNIGTTGTGGVWAFDVSNGGAVNRALGIKPSGSDFNPGFITLRIQNQTQQPIGAFDLNYNILVFNNQDRSNSFNFSYSNDNVNFLPVDSLNFVSPLEADGSPAWVTTARSAFLDDFLILPGQYIYFRWDGEDVSGSGGRDAFALDDIEILAISQLDLIVPTMGEWALMILGMFMLLLVTFMVKHPGMLAGGIQNLVFNLPFAGSGRFVFSGVLLYASGLLMAVLFFGGFGLADLIGGLIMSQVAAYWLYLAMLPGVENQVTREA